MIEIEERITDVRDSTTPLRSTIADKAVATFFDALGDSDYPGEAEVKGAILATESSIKSELLSRECLSVIRGQSATEANIQAATQLSFDSVASPLFIPPPQSTSELPPLKIALAALIGAIAGMMLLAPLTRLLLGMQDVGLFVGPPLGAFLLVLVTWWTSKSKRMRRLLIAACGVAAIGEVWAIITGGGVLGWVWRKLGGRYSGIKRIILYVTVIFLLVIAKRHPSYDRQEYEATVISAIEQWLDSSLLLLTFLSATKGQQGQMGSTAESALFKLGAKIQLLTDVSKDDLPIAVAELVQEAKNVGFEGLDANSEAPKVIDWHEDLEAKYEIFGNIEPGDRVVIDREPTIFEGTVRKKGLVRKYRNRR